MKIGQELPELVKEITQKSINAYADATGDFNPIHVDEEFAAETPFEGTIAHGFYIFGFLSELMTRRFGKAWTTGGTVDVRFKRPVRPGDTIRVKARLGKRETAQGRTTLVFDVSWENQRNEPVIAGQATVTEAP
ncbi:MAG: MaoC family dehydratase [Desulfobacterales bacterium]|nr:MaoC family dehydratase [Desulfobacterales bacterium]